MQDVSKAFNSFNCKVVRPPLNWRVTVVSLSLCSGLVDYTCSYLIHFVWFHLPSTIILHSTQHFGKRFSFIVSLVVSVTILMVIFHMTEYKKVNRSC
jgi:hypothetical protein